MRCRSYIDGQWCDAQDAPVVELGNPADCGDIASTSEHATTADAVRAVEVAVAASAAWKAVSLERRIGVIEALVAAIENDRGEFATAISRETGKTHRESTQEVEATAAETEVQLELFREGTVKIVGEHQIAYEPLGAVLLVTPSNFPLAALMRKLVPALLAGNSAVVKASELTPMTSTLLFACIHELGLPAGAANLVLADGRVVLSAMIEVPGLKAISMTGSNEAGSAIAKGIGDRDIRMQAEMGGSNVAVVLADADLDMAAQAVADHGFMYCGQWCTGTTRVVVEAAVLDEFTTLLLGRAAQIVVGPGSDAASDMGAMISAAHRNRVEEAVAALTSQGAQILHGGKRPGDSHLQHGHFFEPTVLAGPVDSEALSRQEIFGPVVVLIEAADAQQALEKANAGDFGLSCSVFTSDADKANEFIACANSGLCHVNLGTGFRDNALPVLGWNNSGRGIPECGTFARDFFTRTKAIYRAG